MLIFKRIVTGTPLEIPARYLLKLLRPRFKGSSDYWDTRYRSRGNSGSGSYGRLAQHKADVMNEFVRDNNIASVVEFGCGDSNQLGLMRYSNYLGVDVSQAAVELCRERFRGTPDWAFLTAEQYRGERAELSLSLDVVYHLVEDAVFEQYMSCLFDAGARYVVVYSSNYDATMRGVDHVRHRRFSDWVERCRPEFTLLRTIRNEYPWDPKNPDETSWADFYVFARASG